MTKAPNPLMQNLAYISNIQNVPNLYVNTHWTNILHHFDDLKICHERIIVDHCKNKTAILQFKYINIFT